MLNIGGKGGSELTPNSRVNDVVTSMENGKLYPATRKINMTGRTPNGIGSNIVASSGARVIGLGSSCVREAHRGSCPIYRRHGRSETA